MKHLIVPDVHGRKFWEDIKQYPDVPCIFLGDYIDPYTHIDGITSIESIAVLKEIIEYAKSHDNVKLLLGNHDMEYAISLGASKCRYDYENAGDIKKIFEDNKDLFDIAYEFKVGDKRFFCTHAGIHNLWYMNHSELFGTYADAFNAEKLNKLFHEKNNEFISSLKDISRYRGGWYNAGSIVWADIREFFDGYIVKPNDNTVQVVGHTQLIEPILEDKCKEIVCLDSRRCFYVDDDGVIKELKNGDN